LIKSIQYWSYSVNPLTLTIDCAHTPWYILSMTDSNIKLNPAATILAGLDLLKDNLTKNDTNGAVETLVQLRMVAWDLMEWLRTNQQAGGNLPVPWSERESKS